MIDYILNGQGYGPLGQMIAQQAAGDPRLDPGLRRPYLNQQNKPCVTINSGAYRYDEKRKRNVPVVKEYTLDDLSKVGIYSPVANATSLRKEDWIELDRAVIRAARQRLKAWSDLAASSTYGGFDGFANMTLEYEAMSDPGEAQVDMDVLSDGRTDSPLFKLRSLPLPVTHSDFWFSARRLAVSKGMRLDTTMGEAGGRRVAESVEKVTIGVETGVTFGTQSTGVTAHDGNSTVYGYTNLPARITKINVTAPSGGGWVADTFYNEVLSMLDTMYTNKFYGPFMLYHSTDWTQYMHRVYSISGGNTPGETLRSMLLAHEDIVDVRRLDFLTSTFTILLVQMQPETAQAVIGMPIRTVQWESQGGMRLNFKTMCIMVPRLRYDYNGTAAIMHATTA